MTMKHVCGASGFGYHPNDVCPGCEYNRAQTLEGAFQRIAKALENMTVQYYLAKAADCCVPDVREFLKERLRDEQT